MSSQANIGLSEREIQRALVREIARKAEKEHNEESPATGNPVGSVGWVGEISLPVGGIKFTFGLKGEQRRDWLCPTRIFDTYEEAHRAMLDYFSRCHAVSSGRDGIRVRHWMSLQEFADRSWWRHANLDHLTIPHCPLCGKETRSLLGATAEWCVDLDCPWIREWESIKNPYTQLPSVLAFAAGWHSGRLGEPGADLMPFRWQASWHSGRHAGMRFAGIDPVKVSRGRELGMPVRDLHWDENRGNARLDALRA